MADRRVTADAEEATDTSRAVTMVHDKLESRGRSHPVQPWPACTAGRKFVLVPAADGAAVCLPELQGVVLFNTDAVFGRRFAARTPVGPSRWRLSRFPSRARSRHGRQLLNRRPDGSANRAASRYLWQRGQKTGAGSEETSGTAVTSGILRTRYDISGPSRSGHGPPRAALGAWQSTAARGTPGSCPPRLSIAGPRRWAADSEGWAGSTPSSSDFSVPAAGCLLKAVDRSQTC